jgi:hypothetical protein
MSVTSPSGLKVTVEVEPEFREGRAVTKRFSTTAGKH